MCRMFFNSVAGKGRWSLSKSRTAEQWIDEVRSSPVRPSTPGGRGNRAGIKIEMELGIQPGAEFEWDQPIARPGLINGGGGRSPSSSAARLLYAALPKPGAAISYDRRTQTTEED